MLNAKNIAAPSTNKKVDPIDPGTYPARLVQVIALGLQTQRPFKGEEKKPALELWLTYELLDEFMKDEDGNDLEDKPRWISERLPFYSLAQDKAKSTQRYYALDPNEEFDGNWGALLGAPVMVTTGNYKNAKGDIKDKVLGTSAMRPKEAAKAPDLKNPPLVFDPSDPDLEAFERLPDFLKTILKEALDFGGSALDKALGGEKKASKPKAAPKQEADDLDDEIPFEGDDNEQEDW